MRRDRWSIDRSDGLVMARRLPVRWDLMAEASFPAVDPLRLAGQIRQDLWRRLRRLRGFRPAVWARPEGGGLVVRAGGEVSGAIPPSARPQIEAMLANPVLRARWITNGRRP